MKLPIIMAAQNKAKHFRMCGFVEDKGTRNATYILKTPGGRAIEEVQDLYFVLH